MSSTMRSAPAHYQLIRKLGFPNGVRCLCGATLTFRPHERDQDKKRRAFFDTHDACEPPSNVAVDVWLHQQERRHLYP